jgi:hypothetical protein
MKLGKRIQMDPIFLELNIPRKFLEGKVDESRKTISIFENWPWTWQKSKIWEHLVGFQLWNRLKPLEKKFQFGDLWTWEWPCENSTFLSVVHRDWRPPGARKSISPVIFCWLNLNLKHYFVQTLVWNMK